MGSKPWPKHWQTLPALLGRLVPKLARLVRTAADGLGRPGGVPEHGSGGLHVAERRYEHKGVKQEHAKTNQWKSLA